MKKLNLDVIRTDGGTQPRLELDQELVTSYAEQMMDGCEFPPIVVFHDGSAYWLADGFHRYFATKANGLVSIPCEIKQGTLDEATFYAWGANANHGKQISSADKRSIVRKMLLHPVHSKKTNSEIAKHVGVSKMTVGRIKKAMEEVEADTSIKHPDSNIKQYTTKEGNTVTVDTSKLATKKTTERKNTKPDMSSADFGKLEQAEQQIKELSDTIMDISSENNHLKDVIASQKWDATDIEIDDIQDTVKDLREQIRVLEIDNRALRESRDMYQTQNNELIRTVNSLKKKLKNLENGTETA